MSEMGEAIIVGMLVERRKALGLSQAAVGDLMDVSQATVSQFESGTNSPRVSTLLRYSRAVGAEISFEVVAPELDEAES